MVNGMKDSTVISKTNKIMDTLNQKIGYAENVSIKDINLAIVLNAGADERTLLKYHNLLLTLGYIKETRALQVFEVKNWNILTTDKGNPKFQMTLLCFGGEK